MIQSIHITNFQSHRDTSLEFSPGVNVIVGSSDSGKTAIIRALRWLRWNRPSGDAFRSTWGGQTLVRILDKDGHEITRTKNDNINHYIIGNTTLEGFGTDVPEDVTKILNLDETNLQQQLDSPFLISRSSGEVASYFNRIAHLDQIDISLQNVQKEVRSLGSQITSLVGERERSQESLLEFEYLDAFEARLEILEQQKQEWIALAGNFQSLNKLVQTLQSLQEEMHGLEWILQYESSTDAIIEMMSERDREKYELTELERGLANFEILEKSIAAQKTILTLESQVSTVVEMYDSLNVLHKDYNTLCDLLDGTADVEDSIDKCTRNIHEMEKTFHNYMGETCPLCGTNLSNQ
jgi:DNA repair exonuclease SbcCD ATPase subunit